MAVNKKLVARLTKSSDSAHEAIQDLLKSGYQVDASKLTAAVSTIDYLLRKHQKEQ